MLRAPLLRQDLDHVLHHAGSLWEELRGQSIFITGGTGFVGAWLLESLLWANDKLKLEVSATVLSRDPGSFCKRSPHLARHPAVELVRGHITRFDAPSGTFPWVIHAAAERYSAPLESFETDINGIRAVLEFARTHGVQRLLFASSGAVYGRQPPGLAHIPEDYVGAPSTMDLHSAYGEAKRVSEFMCSMYASVYGFNATIARLFAFIGPLLPLDSQYAAGNFIRDALAGGPLCMKGDGTPYRSYLYAADMAVWLWTILLRGQPSRPYNVGSSGAVTISELARTVAEHAGGIGIVRKAAPGAEEGAERYVPSTNRAEGELGLKSWINLSEGVRRTLSWHGR